MKIYTLITIHSALHSSLLCKTWHLTVTVSKILPSCGSLGSITPPQRLWKKKMKFFLSFLLVKQDPLFFFKVQSAKNLQ